MFKNRKTFRLAIIASILIAVTTLASYAAISVPGYEFLESITTFFTGTAATTPNSAQNAEPSPTPMLEYGTLPPVATKATPESKVEEPTLSDSFASPEATGNYTFATGTSGTFTDMSSGTTQLIAAGSDDVASLLTPIGFDFYFQGVGINQNFSVSSNGYVQLGNAVISTSQYTLGASNTNLISAYGSDLMVSSTGKVHYKLTGTAPNRVLTIEFKNMTIIYDGVGTSADGTYQVRLYETTGKIEFVYGPMNRGTGTGFSGANNPQYIGFSNHNSDGNYATATVSTNANNTTLGLASNLPTNGAAIPNVNTPTDGSRRTYSWTPPIPTAPSGLTFTAVSSTGMTLNWADNSSNELQFPIYRSTDGVNYTFVTNAAGNSTSSVQSALSASTTYFWKVYAVSEGGFSTAVSGSQATAAPATITSNVVAGNWSATGTWAGGVVPTAADNVVIADGATVTIDTAAACLNLTVGQGTSGILQYDQVSARTLTVTNDVTVAANGIFKASATGSTGTVTTNALSIGGNFTNNGTVNFSTTAGASGTTVNAAAVGITFTGATDSSFDVSNSAAVTNLKSSTGVTVNKGTSSATLLNFTPTTTYQSAAGATSSTTTITVGSTTGLAPGMFVSVTAGTGAFAVNTTVASVTNATTFVVSTAPTTALSGGASVVTASKFAVQSASLLTGATAGFLSITNGTFKVNGSNTFLTPYFNAVGYSIPATGGFWLNNANATVTGHAGSPTNSGLLRISAGTFNMGTSTGNEMGSAATSSFIFDGGTMNVAGRLNISSSGAQFNMSAGTINVCTVANTSSTIASFQVSSTTSVFTMSGGTINLIQRNTAGTPFADYRVLTTSPTITGGTLNVGTAATATNFNFILQGAMPNVVIDNTTNNKSATLSAAASAYGNTTINSGATLNLGGFTYTERSSTFTNNGILTGTTTSSRLSFFSPTVATQTFAGSGTVTAPLDGLSVQNGGLTISHTNTFQILRANLFAGAITNSNKITLGSGAASAVTTQIGATGSTQVGGSFDVAPIFNLGTGTYTVLYSQESAARTTGLEIPATRTITNSTVDNTNGVTISGGNLAVSTTMTLTNGTFTTDSSNLLTITNTSTAGISGGSTTSYVKGPLVRTLPASLAANTYTFPVGKTGYNLFELVNATTSAAGTVTVQAEAFDANSGGIAGTGITTLNTTRYWSATTGGAGALTAATVRVNESPLTGGRLGQSATVNGTYNSIGSTVSGTTIAGTAATSLGFFNLGNQTIGGAISVCNGGTYPTLKSFFDTVNSSVVTANMTVTIAGDCAEGANTATLNQWTESGAGGYTMTISPSGTRTITGNPIGGTPFIDLNGADRVTINGINDVTNTLTISNTNNVGTAGTSTIRFINGATSNTITNSSILGSFNGTPSTPTAGGNILFSTDASTTAGNDGNTISNNNIGPAGSNLPSVAIYGLGSTSTTAIGNSGNTINNNNIFDYFAAAVTSAGIYLSDGCNTWSITGNRFYQTNTRTWTTGAQHSPIWILGSSSTSGSKAHAITGNTIGYSSNSQTGTYALTGSTGKFIGIYYGGIAGTTATDISSNTIASVSMSGVTSSGSSTSSPFMAIYVNTGVTTTNSNIIGSQGSAGSLTFSTSSTSSTDVYGIYNFSSDIWTSNSNQMGGISVTNGAASGTYVIYGLRANTSTLTPWTATSNTIGGTVANSIQLNATGAASQIIGMVSVNAPITFTSNTIQNLTSNIGTGTGSGSSIIGISNTGTTGPNIITISTIRNLTNTNAGIAANIDGIFYSGPTSGTNTISRNLIHTLTSPSTSAAINGIDTSAGTSTFTNNMISLGTGVTTSAWFNGIQETGGTNNFYFNSVYIGGTAVVTSTIQTFGLYSTVTTNTRNYRNNIFYNARSRTSGTGQQYAIRVGGTTASPTGLTSNNNVLFVSGTGGVLGQFNSVDRADIAAWRTATGQDANSLSADPLFTAPTATTPDLHLSSVTSSASNNAVSGTGIGTDYDGDTRDASTPDIGADEINTTFQFSAANVNDSETNADHSVTITVTRAGSSAGAASVHYATSDGTATTVNNDYVAASGDLTWIAGDGTDKTFTVTVKGDTTFETNETVNITLSAPSGGAISGTNPSTLTITNDDVATPVITLGQSSLTYGSTVVGTSAATQTSTLAGSNLTTTVQCNVPVGDYTVSGDGTNFGNSANFSNNSGSASGTLTVKFTPTAAGTRNDTVTCISTGATNQTISLTGTGAAPPTLGTYADKSITLSSQTTVTPGAAPTNATSINASTNTNFKGTLFANPTTGVVTVTDAHPAGTYAVTVKALGAGGSTTSAFNLTVGAGTSCGGTAAFTNAANVAFATAPNASYSIRVADFNNDGNQDIVATDENAGNIGIRLGDGAGNFSGGSDTAASGTDDNVAVGDFNGDGKMDVAVAHFGSPSTVLIRLGDGAGGLTGTTSLSGVGTNPFAMAVGDFNGDGKQDLAIADLGTSSVKIRLGDGAGGFSGSTSVATDGPNWSIALGDFNSDGKLDFVTASTTASVRLGDGLGGFSGSTNVTVGTNPRSVAVGDFNNDGKQDIATANFTSSTVSIRIGDGAGNFSGSTNVTVGTNPRSVAIGDFNGDGNQDFVVTNNGSGTVSLRMGDGAASPSFSGSVNTTVGTAPMELAVGDFNADGRQDLMVANEGSSFISIRLGGCFFTPTVTSISPSSGLPSGGTSVTITGTNFTGVTAVKFGATNAASFVFNSDTSITAVSPAGTGTVDVTVTTPGGTSATSGADQFTYIAAPTTNASAMLFSSITTAQMGVSWTSGNGANRIVIATEGSAPTGTPADGSAYTASATYGAGQGLGNGYVVYNGSGNSFTLTGLQTAKTYFFKIYEYNGSGANTKYLTTGTQGSGNQQTTATIPTMTTNAASGVTTTSAQLNGIYNPNNSTSTVFFRYSTTNPGACDNIFGIATGTSSTLADSQTFSYSKTPTGLLPGTTYFFCAVGTNVAGAGFGSVLSFATNAAAPTVTTPTSASITSTSAVLGGNATSDGGAAIIERGVVYSVTTVNGDPLISGTGVTKVTAGTGTGVFTASASPLLPDTGYSFKAYATNSVGTTYTSVSTFTTVIAAPATPSITASSPVSPSNTSTTPTISGTAAASATTVNLYTTNDCSGSPIKSGSPSAGTFSIANVPVGANATTLIYANATNLGGTSGCSAGFAYTHDDIAPDVPVFGQSSPATPDASTSPSIQGTAESGSTVKVYLGSTCASTLKGTGTATGGNFSIPVSGLVANSTTIFSATATDAAGNTGACTATPFNYAAYAAPTVTAISPASGSTLGGTSVTITGTNFTGVTGVTIGGAAATSVSFVSGNSITAVTPSGSAGTASVLVTTPGGTNAGNTLYTYIAPTTIVSLTRAIGNPTNAANAFWTIEFASPVSGLTAGNFALVNTGLTGPNITNVLPQTGPPSTKWNIIASTGTGSGTLGLNFVNATGATPGVSTTLPYVGEVFNIDHDPPVAPVFTGSTPTSPGASLTPTINGTAEPDSFVRLYTSNDCTTGLAGSGTATSGNFAIAVTVGANSTTNFYATATDAAGNLSGCSTAFTYINDANTPDTTLDLGGSGTPTNPTTSTSATFTFGGSDTVAQLESLSGFECDLDGGGFTACTSPRTYTGLAIGSHIFTVRAKDLAGNVDPSPESYTWVINALPQTFVVTNTTDNDGTCSIGDCSLRQAINSANADPSADTINFDITGGCASVCVIRPVSDSLAITYPTAIDGYSQPGSSVNALAFGDNAVIKIQLDGTGSPVDTALSDTGGLALRGLSMTNWNVNAIAFTSPASAFSVKGCFIGVAPDGTAAGNSRGISIRNNASQAGTIGSSANADRNVISGNSSLNGIHVFSNADHGPLAIRNNYIGVAPDGATPMGNGVGIQKNAASPLTIGGTGAGEQNIIANNGIGFYLLAGAESNDLISANSFHDNQGLGIDRNANTSPGVTLNAGGALDFPVITSATFPGGVPTVAGTLGIGTPSAPYTIHFYSNASCDPSGNGEGQTYIGSYTGTTDGSGNANFTIPSAGHPAFSFIAGQFITADTEAGSEFSQCTQANAPPTITPGTVSRQRGSAVVNGQIATVTDDGGNGTVTVSAIGPTTSNGVTISNFTNDGSGNIYADAVADCTATTGFFVLRATDGLGAFADVAFQVSTTANSAPVLTYSNPADQAFASSFNVSPTAASDNGSIDTYVVLTGHNFSTAPTVNSSGVVSIINARPAGSHTVTVRATDNCGATTDSTFTVNIGAAPPAGEIKFVSATYTVAENVAGAKAHITYERTGGTFGIVNALFETSNGSTNPATAGSDYTAVSATLSFGDGESGQKTIDIDINNEAIYEADETVALAIGPTTSPLAGQSEAQLPGYTAVLTITNDDTAPTVSISDVTDTEGNIPGGAPNTKLFSFTLTRTGETELVAGANFDTKGAGEAVGLTATEGVCTNPTADFLGLGGNFGIPAGGPTNSITISVQVCGDTTVEPDETFTVDLTAPANATLTGDGKGHGTIVNDDYVCTPPPSGMVAWYTGQTDATDIGGTNSGTETAVTHVSGKVGQAFSFNGSNSMVEAAATSAADITASGFTVDFWMKAGTQAGGNATLIEKTQIGNTGWAFQTNSSTDGKMRFAIGNGSSYPEISSNGSVLDDQFHHITGTWNSTDNTMRLYVDGVLQTETATNASPANNTNTLNFGYLKIGVTRFYTGLLDEVEIFNRALTAAEIGNIYSANTAGKCHTSKLRFAVAADTVDENTGPATFNLVRDGANDSAVSVNYTFNNVSTDTAVGGASCTAGVDYIGANGQLNFASGVSTIAFPVTMCNDTLVEPNETFSLTLTGPTGSATVVAPSTETFALVSDDVNSPPTVAANNATLTVNEGSLASNTGTYGDADPGDNVVITASVGTISKTGTNSGTWSWSYSTTDGPNNSGTVTVTANDGVNPAVTTTFGLTVSNVAPTIALTGSSTANRNATYTLGLGAVTDPGTDTVSAYSVDWGDGVVEPFTGNPTGVTKTHIYTANGGKTILVSLTDEDGTFAAAGTKAITVGTPDYSVFTTGNTIVVTDNTGNGDTLAITEPVSGNIKFAAATRSFAVDGGAIITGDSGNISRTGATSITVNQGGGNDIANVGAFTDTLPSLTINGDAGDDTVNFTGTVTFASNASLDVDMQNDTATPGIDAVTASAAVATSGAGTITIRVSKNVTAGPGGFSSVNGNITIETNQQATPTAGAFYGIDVNGGTIQSTGTGVVTVMSRSGTSGASLYGAFVRGGSLIKGGSTVGVTTTDVIATGGIGGTFVHGIDVDNSTITSFGGDVHVQGFGGSGGGSSNYGIIPISGGTITSGGNGNVLVEGTGGAGGTSPGVIPHQGNGLITSGGSGTVTVIGTGGSGGGAGVQTFRNGKITSGGAGAVSVTGTGDNGVFLNCSDTCPSGINSGTTGAITITGTGSSAGIAMDGGAAIGPGTAAAVTLIADTMALSGNISAGTNTVTVRQKTNGKTINMGGNDSGTQLGLTDTELDRVANSSTLQIGDANTGAVNVSGVITQTKTTNIFSTGTTVLTGGDLGIFGTINSTLGANSGGTVRPGSSPGIINSGNAALSSGSTFALEIGGTTPGSAATNHDQLNVTGSVTLGGTLTLTQFNGFAPSIGQTFVIINNDGSDAVSGTFNALAEGAFITNFLVAGSAAKISYVGGTNNNDVVLTVVPTITASAGANGSISPSGIIPVTPGANQSFNITTNASYQVANVLVDGVSQGPITSFTFTNVTANHTISATFTGIPPTVGKDNASVTVNEGAAAANTGTFAGPSGDTVTITSSVGTVTQVGTTTGTWSWSFNTTDGPNQSQTVTITATDSTNGTSSTTTFPLTVNNVAPTIALTGNNSVTQNTSYTLNLGAVTDPGTDTVSGYSIAWGDGNTDTFAVPPTGSKTHTYTTPGSKTISVSLTDEDGTFAAAGTKVVTVDPLVNLSVSTNTASEAAATAVTVTATATGPVSGAKTVSLAVTGTSITAGDYTLSSATITIPDGGTTGSVTFTVVDDVVYEGTETAVLTISNPLPSGIALGTVTTQNVTIADNDALPTLAVNDQTFGGDSLAVVGFTVTLTGATEVYPVTVHYKTADNTATAGSDYNTAEGDLTFTVGQTTKNIPITVIDDNIYEPDETFFVNLTLPGNATITRAQGIGTITSGDPAPTFAIDDVSIVEGNSGSSLMTFTITKAGTTSLNATVNYATVDGSATSPSDFTAVPATPVTFLPGDTTKQVTVAINGDTTGEPDETFILRLTAPTNATITKADGLGTITNDDCAAPPTGMVAWYAGENNFRDIAGPTFQNGNGGNITFPTGKVGKAFSFNGVNSSFSATRPITPNAVTLDAWIYVDPTAPVGQTMVIAKKYTGLNGERGYQLAINPSGKLNFSGGSCPNCRSANSSSSVIYGQWNHVAGTIDSTATSVYINGVLEGSDLGVPAIEVTNENFVIGGGSGENFKGLIDEVEVFDRALSSTEIATIAGVGSFGKCKAGLIEFATPTYTVNENGVNASITFSRTEGSYGAVSATFNTGNGSAPSATAGNDYTATTSTVSFADGDAANKTILIPINDDAIYEFTENVNLALTAPTNGAFVGPQGTGALGIVDNDTAPTISLVDGTYGGDTLLPSGIYATLTGATEAFPVTVNYHTTDDTAVAGQDFNGITNGTLTFNSSAPVGIPVTIINDTIQEPTEQFFIDLEPLTAVNGTVSRGRGVGTITSGDPGPTFAINDVSVIEGNSGPALVTFTVTKTGSTTLPSTVNFTTQDGTATVANSDYVLNSGALSFSATDTSKQITVTVNGDTALETDELFNVHLTDGGNASFTDADGAGTILNDDCTPMPGNMLSWYSAENNTDDIVGTNSGTAQNGATYATGKVGLAFSFDGVDDRVSLGNPTALQRQDFTIDAWVKRSSASVVTNNPAAFNAGNIVSYGADGYALVIEGATGHIGLSKVGSTAVFSSQAVLDTNFHHLAVTKSGTQVTIYVDGVGQGPFTYTETFAFTSNLAIGAPGGASLQNAFFGSVDEVEIFDRTLSGAEIAALSSASGGGKCHTSTVQFSTNAYSVTEGNVNAPITVTRVGAHDTTATFDFASTAGSATAGATADYDNVSSTGVTFNVGEVSKVINIPIHDDTIFENAETVNLSLTNIATAPGTTAGIPLSAVLTINPDADAAPVLSVNDTSFGGDTLSGCSNAFEVTLSGNTEVFPVTVGYHTTDDTAVAGQDYTATSGTLTFNSIGFQCVPVSIINDTVQEPTEQFFLDLDTLPAPTNATIGDGRGVGTITSGDPAPSFAIDDAPPVFETNTGGTTTATFTITKTGSTTLPSTVHIATQDGTATLANSDYVLKSVDVPFLATDTSKQVTVTINGDNTFELDETFNVLLTSVTNATITDGTGVGTILNDDCQTDPVVTTIADSGPGSLRQATSDACVASTITFNLAGPVAPLAPEVATTITLTAGEIAINKNLTIQGPGASSLIISGNNSSRVFSIGGGPVTIKGVTVTGGNAGGGQGGGIFAAAVVNVTDAVVSGNTAGTGGGIFGAGGANITVLRSTISGNTANFASGTASNPGSSLSLINSTVSGNGGSNGGSVFCNVGATVNVTNTTITNNSPGGGVGGIDSNSGTVTVKNSIIARNTGTNPDVTGTMTSLGYNIIGNVGGVAAFNQTGDQVGVNPLLGPLAPNGSQTPTHALQNGSPAIDKGSAVAGMTTDQRGSIRPVDFNAINNAPGGNGSDIGAFEVQIATAATMSISGRVTSAEGRGITNVRITVTGNSLSTPLRVTTGARGFYTIPDLQAGETYIVSINARQFIFSVPSRVINLVDNVTDADFVADPPH